MRFWSLGVIFDVTGEDDSTSIGCVEEKLTWFFPTFRIISPSKEILAEAELNFWGTKYTIKSALDDRVIAILSRPFFQFFNNWTITIVDPNAISENRIHPHMFLTLIAFQVDRAHWHRLQTELNAHSLTPQNTLGEVKPTRFIKECKKHLKPYCKKLKNVVPKEEDFLAVEALTDFSKESASSSDLYYEHMSKLMALLDSDELTQEQQAALLLMLEHTLNQN